jgi:uncharacterized protein (TIGR02996 family)
MQQEEALVQAILDDPEDDAVRLVYADWFEEHGQAERGEIIRLQIELARTAMDRTRRDGLERRVKELQEAHGGIWLGPLATYVKSYHFDRGMPSVMLAPRALLSSPLQEEAGRWFRAAGVVEITLIGSTRAAQASRSPHLEGIPSLHLANCMLPEMEVARLAKQPHLGNLRRLHLGGASNGLEGIRALANTRHLTRLTALEFLSSGPGADGLRVLVESRLWPQLTELALVSTPMSVADLESLLLALPQGPLRVLRMFHNQIGDRGCMLLGACPAVRSLVGLELSMNEVGPAGARALTASPYLAGLCSLTLDWNGLRDDGALALTGSRHLRRLGWLQVKGCHIGQEGLAALETRFGSALHAERQ